MTMTFKRAARTAKKARIALYGPSGSGKTFTALALASGLGKTTAFIDTERGSAQLYADAFAFDALDLNNFHPDRFIEAIRAAEAEGYDTIIIDSLTHAWQAILEAVDATRGNNFTDGWGKTGTPLYNKLIGAILECKAHVIVCMRSKTEYVVENNQNGKAAPKKLGMAPVMRADTEYEFDLVLTMDDANNATVSKTRMGELLPQRMNRPDKSIGAKIGAWLASGKAPEPKAEQPASPDDPQRAASVAIDWLNTHAIKELKPSDAPKMRELAASVGADISGAKTMGDAWRSIHHAAGVIAGLVDERAEQPADAPEAATA